MSVSFHIEHGRAARSFEMTESSLFFFFLSRDPS